MLLKDYYGTLEIAPSATLAEIKKAYRRLAQQYHPDKNAGDVYAAAQFAEIKEAYEVLTDPSKKEYYLQRRWYDQSTGRRKAQPILTPVTLLKQSLELEKYVSRLDHFRMDAKGLHDYVLELIKDESVSKLNAYGEIEVNDKIVDILLRCIQPVPFGLTATLYAQLGKITVSPPLKSKLSEHARRKKRDNTRDRINILIIIVVVFSICLLIFLLSGKEINR